jgi:hypothetical protein
MQTSELIVVNESGHLLPTSVVDVDNSTHGLGKVVLDCGATLKRVGMIAEQLYATL